MNKVFFRNLFLFLFLFFNITAQIKRDLIVKEAELTTFLLERFFKNEILNLSKISKGTEKIGCPVEIYTEKGILNLFKISYKRNKKKLSLEDCAAFDRELSVLQDLNHPNIIKLYEFYLDELVMFQECASCDLRKYINILRRNKKDRNIKKRIFNIIYQITQGLNYLHENRYVHCDLKTSNIVVFRKKTFRIALIDFSRTYKVLKGQTYIYCDKIYSTPLFTSNSIIQEYCRDKMYNYDFKDDIYSLGMIIYELVYLNKPSIFAQTNKFLSDFGREFDFLEYRKFCSDMPKKQKTLLDKNWEPEMQDIEDPFFQFFNNLIRRCLDINRYFRPSAAEILDELNLVKTNLF